MDIYDTEINMYVCLFVQRYTEVQIQKRDFHEDVYTILNRN